MIKTLIVDDSPLVRSILRDFLESEGSFEIADEAENGRDAVEKAKQHNPDLVTMDIEMPVMNGLDSIVEIRKFSSCGIVVISTHDTAKMAYDATVKGAHEFFAKDIFTSQMTDRQRSGIFNTLKQIINIKNKAASHHEAIKQTIQTPRKINCVVIASSTGGPMALCQLASGLSAKFPVPILLVQHNTSGFDRGFVQWLDGYSQLKIQLAQEGIFPSKGNVYVAPTDKHLTIGAGGIAFENSEPVNNQKPSADLLFKSAAAQYGNSLVSVVLTGMGEDGAQGTRIVKEAGGITIAQDEASSMIYGMPQAAVETGCVDMILPLNEISNKLLELTGGES
ncbi:MAG: chemotaxis-specific protein-glutamate methyltransferase CheB [Treponema sp.]|nr:chemotaxis-specific protein-glutamate methyltransferase CheB [Treponema sp.]MCL2236709.1 chemotaxis-specific protein-glutamate methyltransferase CheB [Treponema sp.]